MSRPIAKGTIKSIKAVDHGAGSHIQLNDGYETTLPGGPPPEGVFELEFSLGYNSMLSIALAAFSQDIFVDLTFDDPPQMRGTTPIVRAIKIG